MLACNQPSARRAAFAAELVILNALPIESFDDDDDGDDDARLER
jgi:hypothetical protein